MGVVQPSLFKWLRLCESFVSFQMAANQVFQGAGCFAHLVFFWDHAARKGCQGTFGSDKSHEVREPIPGCRGTFCATCRSLPIAKEQTKTRVLLMQKLFSDVLI